jgi:hypothetical protein
LIALRNKSQAGEAVTGMFRHLHQIRSDAKDFLVISLAAVCHLGENRDRLSKYRVKIQLNAKPLAAPQRLP